LPWHDKKVAVFKALKKAGAVSASTAKAALEIAKLAGCTPRDVLHYVYHAKAARLADVAEVEGIRGYAFHLTAKGAKLDPVAEQKAEQAAKD
jgi:hypothetical protein